MVCCAGRPTADLPLPPRTPETLKTLERPETPVAALRSQFAAACSPPYATKHPLDQARIRGPGRNCTHLGCISDVPTPAQRDVTGHQWLAGHCCPATALKYDPAGRVYSGVPAPYNLPVPPYTSSANDSAHRRKSGRLHLGFRFDPPTLSAIAADWIDLHVPSDRPEGGIRKPLRSGSRPGFPDLSERPQMRRQ